MTYDQYWNDDPDLVRYYRQAAEIKAERKNQELWLQGMYFYDALCCASPILRSFAKKGTKPVPYTNKPYLLNAKQRKKDKESTEKKIFEKGKARMAAFMERVNAQFERNQILNAERREPDGDNS